MRFDLQLIPEWIKSGSRVLDLGCGDGALLKKLFTDKQVDGLGIEIDDDHLTACIASGLSVVEQDLNKGLDNFQDNSFDVVVMAHALQTLRDPHLVIDEMLRVGKECIVTFPNFAHWRCSQPILPICRHSMHQVGTALTDWGVAASSFIAVWSLHGRSLVLGT